MKSLFAKTDQFFYHVFIMHQNVSRSDIRGSVNVSCRSLVYYSPLSSFMEMCHHALKDLKKLSARFVRSIGHTERALSCDLLIKGALHCFGLVSNEIFRGCHICQI